MSISDQTGEESSAVQSKQRLRVRCAGNSTVQAQWDELDRCSRVQTPVPRQDTGKEDAEADGEKVGLDG